jgi:hypothetical protein
MDTNDTYKQKLNTLLTKWDDQINLLYIMAKDAESDVKLKHIEELDVLHTKKRETFKLIKELESPSDDALEGDEMNSDSVWGNARSVA